MSPKRGIWVMMWGTVTSLGCRNPIYRKINTVKFDLYHENLLYRTLPYRVSGPLYLETINLMFEA